MLNLSKFIENTSQKAAPAVLNVIYFQIYGLNLGFKFHTLSYVKTHFRTIKTLQILNPSVMVNPLQNYEHDGL